MEDKKKKIGGWSTTSRFNEEQSLGDVLARITGKGHFADKLLEAEIVRFYEQMVGKNVARMTENIYVNKEKLYIKVSSPALRQELVYSREKIRELVNEKLKDIADQLISIKEIKEIVII